MSTIRHCVMAKFYSSSSMQTSVKRQHVEHLNMLNSGLRAATALKLRHQAVTNAVLLYHGLKYAIVSGPTRVT